MSEMVNMAPPWLPGMTQKEVTVSRAVAASQRLAISSELAASAPTGWIELMQQCWDQDPKSRPNFDVILGTLNQIESSILSQSTDGESPSRLMTKQNPKAWFQSRPIATPETIVRAPDIEMITHAGNNRLKRL